MDDSNTEIEDVFLELLEAHPDICLKIQERLLDECKFILIE